MSDENPIPMTPVEPTETPEADAPSPALSTPACAVAELVAGRVRGGQPILHDSDGLPTGLAAGAAVRLEDTDGAGLGFAICDPENDCWRVWPFLGDENPKAPDYGFFRRRVRRAVAWRKRLSLVSDEGAFRLLNGEGDGLAGITVDIYAKQALVNTFAEALLPYAKPLADALLHDKLAESVVAKIRPAGETPVGRVEFQTLSPEPPPREIVVVEDDVRYEVHLLGGLNTGLFCDMRDVRRAVRNLATGQRVLNLFAYTGSFSVIAALADAKSVTTVEFAGGVVEWAKTNFRLNELPVEDRRFRFLKADVFEFLKAARRKEDVWDLIVLDPPAVSTAPGRKWRLKSDYDRLIAHTLKVLAPGGIIVVAANTLQSRPEGVEKQIREAARQTGRRLRLIDSFGLPADFPTQMIHPESRYLKVFVLWSE